MNIIVSGAKNIGEYKAKRAAILKMAEDILKKYNHGTPDGVYLIKGDLKILYTNGDCWIYKSTGEALKEDNL